MALQAVESLESESHIQKSVEIAEVWQSDASAYNGNHHDPSGQVLHVHSCVRVRVDISVFAGLVCP